MVEIVNARIENVRITLDRGVFLSMWINLDYGGSGQGYGGYCFNDKPPKIGDERPVTGPQFGMACQQLMKTFEVEDFKHIKGKICRVKLDGPQYGAKIEAIGHPLKDKWFSFQKLFKTIEYVES